MFRLQVTIHSDVLCLCTRTADDIPISRPSDSLFEGLRAVGPRLQCLLILFVSVVVAPQGSVWVNVPVSIPLLRTTWRIRQLPISDKGRSYEQYN